MAVINLNQSDFEAEVLKAEMPVLVDFYAQWCGPCKMAAPVLDKLSEEFAPKVKIVKIDVDQSRDLAQKYQIMSIPTIVAFKNGQEVARKVGFPGEAGYKAMLEEYIK
ncbi:thioredoxin [Candidatus Beckwithbacteria bacterium RBG_13_42_9]|uniref:Thioredoxin n=1 Tax=Candidatus Beckwithbacteria bacterium RBG_13_42_9 TaxID=1797457 RepID=A0A1F5E6B0_9BACT|nr:MAG: thioredoxin [Candidatus Beckwithbacteria bacterium RBG_13_42_9]